jgi:hypothetical protein
MSENPWAALSLGIRESEARATERRGGRPPAALIPVPVPKNYKVGWKLNSGTFFWAKFQDEVKPQPINILSTSAIQTDPSYCAPPVT